MKKFFSVIALSGLLFFSLPIGVAKAADTLDRSCNAAGSPLTATIGTGSWQTFSPSQNRLSKVSVDVFRNDNDNNVMVGVTLKISNDFTRSSMVMDAGSKKVSPGGSTLVYDFTDIEMIPGNPYRITLTTTGDVAWRQQDDTCYHGGDAYQNSKISNPRLDYGFATYGYTVEDNPPVSATDLDEDEDTTTTNTDDDQLAPITTDQTTQADQTTTPTQTNAAAAGTASPVSSTAETVNTPASTTSQVKNASNDSIATANEEIDFTLWYIIGGFSLAVVATIILIIYLRSQKKRNNILKNNLETTTWK